MTNILFCNEIMAFIFAFEIDEDDVFQPTFSK